MSIDLGPAEVELIARLVRAYGICPAADDRPTIEHVLDVLTPLVSRSFINAVA